MRARKDQFFGTFDSAVTHLINTVEVAYLEVNIPVVEMKMSVMMKMTAVTTMMVLMKSTLLVKVYKYTFRTLQRFR